jgi:large subunit ribosomal protein L5e
MGFVKVVKTKAYFKRYQVKYRRRREGKTDYYARKRLIIQDKNKFNSPKFRFVVRFTNKDIITQIVSSKIEGDKVLAAAYGHELVRYGFPVKHATNYAAAYATGLLLARRVLTKLNLADKYQGNSQIDGTDYNVAALEDGPHPFRALLDVGLRRTTTGSKLFATLKGAADGGLEVPHSDRRFVGYDDEGKKGDPETLRKHIFGGHVADYMKLLQEDQPAKFDKHFAAYTKAGILPDKLQEVWAKVHKNIRANPAAEAKKPKQQPTKGAVRKRFHRSKKSLAQRKNTVQQKKDSFKRKQEAGGASAAADDE